MNHTKICLSSSEIITPFFVSCVKIADWLGSNSLAIWSLCLSSSFWILLLEPAMIFMWDFFISKLFWSLLTIHFLACWNIFTKKHSEIVQFFTLMLLACGCEKTATWHSDSKKINIDTICRYHFETEKERNGMSDHRHFLWNYFLAHWCEEIIFSFGSFHFGNFFFCILVI